MGAFVAVAAVAVKKVKDQMDLKTVPFLGMAASFSFLIMMFNIPIPGGTTGHAVGAAAIALLLGPWVAFIAVSVALIIQALIFGDGGITAIGANCFNIGFVMSFAAWYIFKWVNRWGNRYVAVFLAAYLSLAMAALVTGIEFGIQPLIASGADGNPLYAPYPLSVAVPVMLLEHLVLFGFVEAIVTLVIFRYFEKNFPDNLEVLKR